MRFDVSPSRVVGVDVARCLALLGMIATHALPVRDPDGDLALAHELAGGRASALFALLAGVSLALMSGRAEPLRGRARRAVTAGLAVRAGFIALVGLVLGELPTTIAIILTYYGVLFLLGLPFLGLRARSLAFLAAGWLIVAPVVSHLVRHELPPRGFDSPRLEQLAHPVQLLTELTFTGYYPAVPWLAYLLAGMAIGRTDLTRVRTAAWFVLGGGWLALASLLASRQLLRDPDAMPALVSTAGSGATAESVRQSLEEGTFGTTPTGSWWWLAVHGPHSGTPFDLAHTIGTAMLVIGLCLLLGRWLPRLSAVLFGAGAMTLTLYTLHVVMRTPGILSDDDAPTFWTHVAVVLVIGATFRLMSQRGPMEQAATALSEEAAEKVRRS
jgi:uncharacterized membrane protein